MFKLNHENYVKSLESVQELERVLLEEMDNQQEIEDSVRDIWVGRQMLSKAAECAGEYLNLSGIEDLISKGEKKIKRLQNYQYEFDLFAQKMSDLESSMSTDLSTVMRETGDEVTADKCMELVVSDSEQRVQEMRKDFANRDYIASIINKIIDVICKQIEYVKEQYYNLLPEELKKYLSTDDILVSDDGYIMLTKSLADIMEEMGITDTNTSETNKNDVQSFYDDWYIYGVKDNTGNIIYSLVKMREKENDSNIGDKDEPGVTISFIEFDINKLTSLCAGQTDEKINELTNEIDRVVQQKNQSHNTILQEYFSKTESKAPYIIADAYIRKIANNAENNRVELPEGFEDAPKRLTDALKRINEDAGHTVYDEENKCIHINDVDDLSNEEKYAILTAYTSNVSYNSFAAEVEFHSDALVDWKRYIPILGETKWYESAIRADMAFGEEKESNNGGGFDEYYDLESEIVKMQAKIHGER